VLPLTQGVPRMSKKKKEIQLYKVESSMSNNNFTSNRRLRKMSTSGSRINHTQKKNTQIKTLTKSIERMVKWI
jgi:hypothetical protein